MPSGSQKEVWTKMKKLFTHLGIFVVLLAASNWWVSAFLKIRIFNAYYVGFAAVLLTLSSYHFAARLQQKWYLYACSGVLLGAGSGLLAFTASSLVYAFFRHGRVDGPLEYGVFNFIGVAMGWSLMLGTWLVGATGFVVIYLAAKNIRNAGQD